MISPYFKWRYTVFLKISWHRTSLKVGSGIFHVIHVGRDSWAADSIQGKNTAPTNE